MAEEIVFAGYRFPPSDSEARQALVNAVGANKAVEHLILHVVLGPDTASSGVLRMKGILEHAMSMARRTRVGTVIAPNLKTYDLRVHPLNAEDYLDLFQ